MYFVAAFPDKHNELNRWYLEKVHICDVGHVPNYLPASPSLPFASEATNCDCNYNRTPPYLPSRNVWKVRNVPQTAPISPIYVVIPCWVR